MEQGGFNIGLAMAGAASAGAYTAGVFDFLVEALNEWQKAKVRGDDVPRYEVFISAISGSSAGGTTAAVGLASLAGGVRSVEEPSANPKQDWRVRRVLPEIYDVWVKKTRLFGSRNDSPNDLKVSGSRSLLDAGDIGSGKMPRSLLNSDVLTAIARESLSAIRPAGERYAFFADPTHLFLTHTNLDGIPYPITFEKDVYWMRLHEGRAHFAVTGIGTHPFPPNCQWLATWNDHGTPIDLGGLDELAGTPSDRPLKEPFESLAEAALTTSAFPFGWQARQASVDTAGLWQRALPFEAGNFPTTLTHQNIEQDKKIKTANFVCIDGGAMNNEPFDLVRWTIRDLDERQNARDPKTANRAVILIAPFPTESSLDVEKIAKGRADDLGLPFVLKTLFPTLLDQARFKVSDLIAAADPNVYSRYLISPKRDNEKPALACNLLYHFGGFLDEQFREHDFQIGRRNCQWFLREHFTLDPSNPVFGHEGNTAGLAHAQIPIIPLVGTADVPVPLPPWPKFSEEKLTELREALSRRVDSLVPAFIAQIPKRSLVLYIASIAARLSWWSQRDQMISSLMQVIERELVDNNQIERSDSFAQAPTVVSR